MHANTITILAGGWSAAKVNLARLPGTVIGVNDAVCNARCDIAVSMDRLWTENRWHFLRALARPTYIRVSALKNIHEAPEWLRAFDCDYKSSIFSSDPGILNGTNSGACALNLAYQLSPQRLYLLGFDMNRSPDGTPYWFPPYAWAKPEGGTGNARYAEWAKQFEDAAAAFKAANTEVFNVSLSSAIASFERMAPEEFEKRECR